LVADPRGYGARMDGRTDLLVIGAGPYAYAAAAHARSRGVRTTVVGRPMAFWREHMPAEMFLRSGPDWHLDADAEHTFAAYFEDRGYAVDEHDPIPIGVFLDHTEWFRQNKQLQVDERQVADLTKPDGTFVATMEDGGTTEVAAIGGEGMVGTTVLLGDPTASFDCIAQIPGPALALGTETLLRHVEASPTFRKRMLRFIQALTFHTAQSAACTAHHPLQKRCARWLLAAADRRRSHDLPVTHDFLAMMLGVRRAGVTEAIGGLQRAGLIRTEPGRLTIVDREGLEAAACECYGRVRDEYLRLLEDPVSRAAQPVDSAARPGANAALPSRQPSDYQEDR